jgi:hypothetical protein
MKTKRFFIAVLATFILVSLGSCSKDLNIQKSLKGTTWSAVFPDDEGWVDLDFISETSVVLVGYDYDGTVEIRVQGTYTYESPIVSFSFIYDDWCNKFKTKIVDKQMHVTWVDEDIDFEVEGLTFKLK